MSLRYASIFYWPMAIPMVLYHLLLAHWLSLWYSTIVYWTPFYINGTATIISRPVVYLYGTLLSSSDPLVTSKILYFHLPIHYLSLMYSPIMYWPICYRYGTLLLSTCPLATAMVLYYYLHSHWLSLWYFAVII